MSPPLPMSVRKADVIRLPFPDGAFDIAVAVHLFYFIPQWEKAIDEILRVLRQDGPLVLIHTGTGTEVPSLNARYRELCSEEVLLLVYIESYWRNDAGIP